MAWEVLVVLVQLNNAQLLNLIKPQLVVVTMEV
jgi:hypothetical protein